MKTFKALYLKWPLPVFGWVFLSVMASCATVETENCQNDYPIGYVINIKLFCPIAEEVSDE